MTTWVFWLTTATLAPPASAERLGAAAVVPPDPGSFFSRQVNDRPGHGETVTVNPPRMSWRYHPTGSRGPDRTFTLQIAPTADFAKPAVELRSDLNFANALAPLPGPGPWYWRVRYDPPGEWSAVRRFTIAPNATVWDRSRLDTPNLGPHPRILFTAESLPAIRRLRESNAESAGLFELLRQQADRAIAADWWQRFPANDRDEHRPLFLQLGRDLATVAFVWRLTEDPQYRGVLERAVTFASYPQGGRSSPEGAGGESAEDSTQNNEFLALLYDWLHPDLTPAQRQVFVESLAWRTQFWMDNWAWRRKGEVRDGTLPVSCSSHAFEGSMDSAVTALALYGDHPLGEAWYRFMANYLCGVTCGMGFEESWNEGPGYGNSKMKWLMHAASYYQTAVPDVDFGRNRALRAIGDFFCRLTPVGLQVSPWGNIASNAAHVRGGRLSNFRMLAYLTGEGRFLRHWQELKGELKSLGRPWIEVVLPYHRTRPAETPLEADPVKLFRTDGWVTASTRPPSDGAAWREAVGFILQARPRGGYSHSFNSDGSFQLHAYGEALNHGGGSTANGDAYAYHAMSHNTILIDGLGQAQNGSEPVPCYARVVGFHRGPRVVHAAADLTWAYPHQPGSYARWSFPVGPPYTQRAADHLTRCVRHLLLVDGRYFVIHDDLAASRPAQWTWIYHVVPEQPFHLDAATATVDYQVGQVPVRLVHAAHRAQLTIDDRRGAQAAVNPLTGEDYRKALVGQDQLPAHALWFTSPPAAEWSYLTVAYPTPPGGQVPRIEPVDDRAVRVGEDVIAFDGRADAAISVDAAAFRGLNEPAKLLALAQE